MATPPVDVIEHSLTLLGLLGPLGLLGVYAPCPQTRDLEAKSRAMA